MKWWYENEEREMEFDKSRIYSAVNADELRAGDKVIVANCLADLMGAVEKNIPYDELAEVRGADYEKRFILRVGNLSYALAYLVERAENCTNCEKFKTGYCIDGWDVDAQKRFRCENYTPKTEQKAEPHYRPFKSAKELVDNVQANYTDVTLPYIWVKGKKASVEYTGWLITGIGYDGVALGDTSLTWEDLFEDWEFLDGSPCGVEE